MSAPDPRLDEARAIPILDVAYRLGIEGLVPVGIEHVGPCPSCGGRDRFAIIPSKQMFHCRRECPGGSGDTIALVRLVHGCDFKSALSWLAGEAELTIDPAEAARRDAERAKKRAEDERKAEQARSAAEARARAIWGEGMPAAGTPVAEYLALRGLPAAITDRLPPSLRYHADLAYTVPGDRRGTWEVIYRGPAMLGAIVDASGRVTAVHRTWLDLDRPNGKAQIASKGSIEVSKKVLGSMKGGAIRLHRARQNPDGILVMGEGIETTLSACAADVYPGAAYWSGVSLGNMAGKRQLGVGMKFAGLPDLDDRRAFIPPVGIRWLIFIQDGDSEPRFTRAQLLSGLRRARALVPGLERASIVHAGAGRDLNDLLNRKGETDDADCKD